MSERGKQDRVGLVVKIAGAVTAVAGAAAAVFALIPNDPSRPPPPPPPAIRGDIFEISTEPGVTLAEYQQRSPYQPKRCADSRSPAPAAKEVAMAPGRAGGGVAPPTATIVGGALRIAQSSLDVRATQDTTTTEPRPDRPSSTGTTTTGTTTTGTTTNTTTTTTGTTSTPAPRPGVPLRRPSTPALTLGGEPSLGQSQTAKLLLTTRTSDPTAAGAAVERIKRGDSSGNTALKREIAGIADELIGEVVSFRVRIIGLASRCSYVRWSLYDAKTRRRAKEPQLANRDALYFRTEAVEDVASSSVWVGLPRRKGPFFVRLELFKQEGSGLAGANSPKFG